MPAKETTIIKKRRLSKKRKALAECSVVIPDFKLICPEAPQHHVREIVDKTDKAGKIKRLKKAVWDTTEVEVIDDDGKTRMVEKKIPKLRRGFIGVSKDGKVTTYQGRITRSRIIHLIRELAQAEYERAYKEENGDNAAPSKPVQLSVSCIHMILLALKANAHATACYANAHRQFSGGKRKTLTAGDVHSAALSNPLIRVGVGIQSLFD